VASAGEEGGPLDTQVRVAASRASAKPVGMPGARQRSQSSPGATSGDDRCQPVASVNRLDTAAPSPTACATHEAADVSSTHPPLPSTTTNDDQ
jgi:hypothetical protein